MTSTQTDTEDGGGIRSHAVLGSMYLLVGVGLFLSLLVDSLALFGVVLLATLALVVVSLYIVFRREGLVTPENKLIGVFVLAGVGLMLGLYEFTDLPSELVIGAVMLVAVVTPMLLLQYTEYAQTENNSR